MGTTDDHLPPPGLDLERLNEVVLAEEEHISPDDMSGYLSDSAAALVAEANLFVIVEEGGFADAAQPIVVGGYMSRSNFVDEKPELPNFKRDRARSGEHLVSLEVFLKQAS